MPLSLASRVRYRVKTWCWTLLAQTPQAAERAVRCTCTRSCIVRCCTLHVRLSTCCTIWTLDRQVHSSLKALTRSVRVSRLKPPAILRPGTSSAIKALRFAIYGTSCVLYASFITLRGVHRYCTAWFRLITIRFMTYKLLLTKIEIQSSLTTVRTINLTRVFRCSYEQTNMFVLEINSSHA